MKTCGVSDIPKFRLLVFLGHPTEEVSFLTDSAKTDKIALFFSRKKYKRAKFINCNYGTCELLINFNDSSKTCIHFAWKLTYSFFFFKTYPFILGQIRHIL